MLVVVGFLALERGNEPRRTPVEDEEGDELALPDVCRHTVPRQLPTASLARFPPHQVSARAGELRELLSSRQETGGPTPSRSPASLCAAVPSRSPAVPSRHTLDRTGQWKASSRKKEMSETVYRGGFMFCVSSLAYFKGPVGKEKKTSWLMREYTIPQFEIKLNKSGVGDAGRTVGLDQFDNF
ncbi:hypothetical protein ABZP36_014107 [Zizania latifolia]